MWLCFWVFPLQAQTTLSVGELDIPLTMMASDGQTPLTMVGWAHREYFGTKAYLGVLYSQKVTSDVDILMEESTAICMRFYVLSSMDPQAIQNIWLESVSVNNSDVTLSRYTPMVVQFREVLSQSFRQGDVIDIEYSPTLAMTFKHNDALLSDWTDRVFFNMTLSTWIGDHPPSRDFKRAILNFPVSKPKRGLLKKEIPLAH